MALKVRIEGLRELEKALAELPKATGKNVLRRVLKKRAEPIAINMVSLAPVRSGALGRSVDHGPIGRLSRRQKAMHRKWGSSTAVEWFIGAGTNPQSITQEFGTFKEPAQPFARPAWDAGKMQMLGGIKDDLWMEIQKSAERLARKRARAAGAG
ncbi:HK97-gp10 family putative phage morphogenesis protein [Acuticoccus sediminis]|uniref:HK97-gp10 family putative phage morphogenesis protein n=1 Tax=Acuticoccus sediminis TaxID=2184697 RepID=UPI001CFDC1C5|nr:HK97-gp10 family putative phage morphogenesis protein [Acuticoccus sediminis]